MATMKNQHSVPSTPPPAVRTVPPPVTHPCAGGCGAQINDGSHCIGCADMLDPGDGDDGTGLGLPLCVEAQREQLTSERIIDRYLGPPPAAAYVPPPMLISAMAPWFGGKRTMAPVIVAELGPHRCYWEPAVGGCAILPAKPKCSHETVNDLHGDMTNLLRVVQSDEYGPALFERLLRTTCSDALLSDCDAVIRGADYEGAPNVDRAFAFYVVCWMGRNGEMGLKKNERGRQVAVRWSGNGGSPGMRFKHAVDSLPAWWARLRGVTVIRRDLFDVLGDIRDEEGTVIYLDPPYLAKSDQYLYDFENNGGGAMFPDDHVRMAESVRRFKKARVVVSYYAHPRLAELYPGWTVVDHSRAKHMSNASAGSGTAPEVLIVNGRSLS